MHQARLQLFTTLTHQRFGRRISAFALPTRVKGVFKLILTGMTQETRTMQRLVLGVVNRKGDHRCAKQQEKQRVHEHHDGGMEEISSEDVVLVAAISECRRQSSQKHTSLVCLRETKLPPVSLIDTDLFE